MTLVLILAALALVLIISAILLALTGGHHLVHTDHDLPEPAHYARRGPKGT